jgi:hypothetical protein
MKLAGQSNGIPWKRFWVLSWTGARMLGAISAHAAANVYLTEVPDYSWHGGCFGTATGNLMGFWDRHGFPDFYTGTTAYGLAPLNDFGANLGIHSLWASEAGVDGRPADMPGHMDDYYVSYANTGYDPYALQGRTEHEPDCLGDFIGLSQNKWRNLNGECDGNIDGYAFAYWDTSGERRANFTPGPEAGLPAIDIQSGLRAWTEYRGFKADVFTQLGDINPEVPRGKGFTFQDLKAEIDEGYPVLFFLQEANTSRVLSGMERANPLIHAILAYGYVIGMDGAEYVRYRSGFASGDTHLTPWKEGTMWHQIAPLRGVIGYHPRPQITEIVPADGQITIQWHGPDAELFNVSTGTTTKLHWYVVEQATSLAPLDFKPVTHATTMRPVTIKAPSSQTAFFRVSLVPPPEGESE